MIESGFVTKLVWFFLLPVLVLHPVCAGALDVAVGGKYHVDHSEFEELPFDDGDPAYGVAFEFHDKPAYWQAAVTYAPDVGGTNLVDSVITPELNLIVKDQSWLAGTGVLSSYVEGKDEKDWTDLYWQILLGFDIPVSRASLAIHAYYTFESWGDITDFDTDDLEFGAWLGFSF